MVRAAVADTVAPLIREECPEHPLKRTKATEAANSKKKMRLRQSGLNRNCSVNMYLPGIHCQISSWF